MAAASSSKFDPTQTARILAESCERESRAAARHPAARQAAARPFTLAGALAKGALPLKPNATRPEDWRVDEAAASAARAKLAALAPHAQQQLVLLSSSSSLVGPAGGAATSADNDDEWRRVLPASTNGEYGSHLALISAALQAEAEAEAADAAEAATSPSSALAQTLGLLTGSAAGGAASSPRSPIWAPDHGRKTSAVTQHAEAYVQMLGHSPFSSLGRATAGSSGGGGGKSKRGA